MSGWSFGRKHREEGPAWPVGEDGLPVPGAVAATLPDGQLAADSALALLRACGIPARTQFPGDGGFGRVVLGASGYGVQLLVPQNRLEEAVALLQTDAGDLAEEEAGS